MTSQGECKGDPKLAVVGTGPVGGILAAHLAAAGEPVVACDVLASHLEAIRREGLRIHGCCELVGRCRGTAEGPGGLKEFPSIDTVLVCTKASVMPTLLPELAAAIPPDAVVVACQNGLGNEDFLARTFGADRVLRIVVNYAGGMISDGEFRMSFFHPPNWIGALSPAGEPKARALAETLTAAGLRTDFTTEVRKHAWEKSILNTSLNPVCALAAKTMKDIMDHPVASILVEELLHEAMRVAEADGIHLDADFLAGGLKYLRTAGYHRTSMHQDILRGIPTEVDWLNGEVVARGRKLGVPTPLHFAIFALIKGLEMTSGAPPG